MASIPNISNPTFLTENDIPGASLLGRKPEELTISELNFWHKCCGDAGIREGTFFLGGGRAEASEGKVISESEHQRGRAVPSFSAIQGEGHTFSRICPIVFLVAFLRTFWNTTMSRHFLFLKVIRPNRVKTDNLFKLN